MSKTSKTHEVPAILITNEEINKGLRQRANASTEAFLHSSKNHDKALKDALVDAILLVAKVDVGDVTVLNNLYSKARHADAETMRFIIVSMTREYGFKLRDDRTGKETIHGFLTFRDKKWQLAKAERGTPFYQAIQDMRNACFDAGQAGKLHSLRSEPDANKRLENAEREFDENKYMSGVLKKLISEGKVADAKAINRIGNYMPDSELAELEIEKSPLTQLEKLRQKQNKLMEKHPELFEKATKTETSDETSKAA